MRLMKAAILLIAATALLLVATASFRAAESLPGEISDEAFRGILASILEVFPHVVAFRAETGDAILLVGEAAGLANPLTGEGIDYALESGRIAAELGREQGSRTNEQRSEAVFRFVEDGRVAGVRLLIYATRRAADLIIGRSLGTVALGYFTVKGQKAESLR